LQGFANAQLERLAGYALVQAREPARKHGSTFDASLSVARKVEAEYEVALTLRGPADTKLAEDVDAARRESEDRSSSSASCRSRRGRPCPSGAT
jgi:hypothetical protein